VTLSPFIPQPVLIPGITPTQVQDFALGLVEPHELVEVPLDGIPSFWRVNCTTQLDIICDMNLIVLFELVNWKNKIVSGYKSQSPGGSSHNLPTRIPEEIENMHC